MDPILVSALTADDVEPAVLIKLLPLKSIQMSSKQAHAPLLGGFPRLERGQESTQQPVHACLIRWGMKSTCSSSDRIPLRPRRHFHSRAERPSESLFSVSLRNRAAAAATAVASAVPNCVACIARVKSTICARIYSLDSGWTLHKQRAFSDRVPRPSYLEG